MESLTSRWSALATLAHGDRFVETSTLLQEGRRSQFYAAKFKKAWSRGFGEAPGGPDQAVSDRVSAGRLRRFQGEGRSIAASRKFAWEGGEPFRSRSLVPAGRASTRSLNANHIRYNERDFWWAREDMDEAHVALVDEAFLMLNESHGTWSSLQYLADYYDLPRQSLRHRVNRDRHIRYLNGDLKLRYFTRELDSGVAHSYVFDYIHINENFLGAMVRYLRSLRRNDVTRRACVLSELASTLIHETAHAAGFVQGQSEGFAYLAEYYWKYKYSRHGLRREWSGLEECCAHNEPSSWIPEDYPIIQRERSVKDEVCWSRWRFDSDLEPEWRNCGGGRNCH